MEAFVDEDRAEDEGDDHGHARLDEPRHEELPMQNDRFICN